MSNLEKTRTALLKKIGNEPLYYTLYHGAATGSIDTRLLIDNGNDTARELVDWIVGIVDCMLEQIDRDEPSDSTDYFTMVADGERMHFDPAELMLDGDESEIAKWKGFRERFLKGRELEFEHQFISEPFGDFEPDFGIPGLLADLLRDGRFAQTVTMTVVRDNGDYTNWREFRLPNHQRKWRFIQRSENWFFGQNFWMCGMFNGRFVCGEAPFIQDDAALMSIGRWYQSNSADIEDGLEGIRLVLAPNMKSEIKEKALALLHRFRTALNCDVEAKLSPWEYLRINRTVEPLSKEEKMDFVRDKYIHSYGPAAGISDEKLKWFVERESWETQRERGRKPAETNEQMVRAWLPWFEEARRHFTDEEAERLEACCPRVHGLMTRHAAEKYNESEIEAYRFGVCLLCLLSVLGTCRKRNEDRAKYALFFDADKRRPVALEELGWPMDLVRKAETLKDQLKDKPQNAYGRELEIVGMNDTTEEEGFALETMYNEGAFIRIFNISLNCLGDVKKLENLLNELVVLERLCQASEGNENEGEQEEGDTDPLSLCAAMGWCNDLSLLWASTLARDDRRRDAVVIEGWIPEERGDIVTNREFNEYLLRTGACQSETNVLVNEPFTFEAMDDDIKARLRFRRDGDRFIHEVSILD